jgi:hypothetical protein
MKKGYTLEEIKKEGRDPRRIFQIMIDDKLYWVYSIEGYTHIYGENNGCPNTWWLDYSDYEITLDPEENEEDQEERIRELIPYIDLGVHRVCWEIRYSQHNYMKYKWDDFDLRNGGICNMYANGKHVYSFRSRDMGYALSRAHILESQLIEHPFDFLNPEKEIGRKIWYYNLPATIRLGVEQGEIGIDPDYTYMSKDEWWKELERRKERITKDKNPDDDDSGMERDYLIENRDSGWINHGDALFDGMIWWFRD